MVGTSYLYRSKKLASATTYTGAVRVRPMREILLQALLREIDSTEGEGPLNERKTFAELCD
jgi:hypothetical protein